MKARVVAVHDNRVMPLVGSFSLESVGDTINEHLVRVAKYITNPDDMPVLVVLPCRDDQVCPWRDTGGEG